MSTEQLEVLIEDVWERANDVALACVNIAIAVQILRALGCDVRIAPRRSTHVCPLPKARET